MFRSSLRVSLAVAFAIAIAAGVALSQTTRPTTEPADPSAAFFAQLDKLYTWGDLVEELRCRVHGRWLTFAPSKPDSGQFWGNLTYRDGHLDFTVDRTLGRERPREEWRQTVHTLIEQAGLLPTGFPIPEGPIVRVDERTWRITPTESKEPLTYRMVGGRLGRLTIGKHLQFDVATQWIPGDRYLLTRLAGRRVAGRRRAPRIDYTYRVLARNYFPRAISEERRGESITLLFYRWEVHLDYDRLEKSKKKKP